MAMSRPPTLVFGSNYGPNVDTRRWVVIYPPYLDSLRTEAAGRKIAKDKGVEKPSMAEVFDCVQKLKLQTALELDKAYCRDYWQRGRVRVRLFDEDGKPFIEDIPTRRILYARVAALIPTHREAVKQAQSKQRPSAAKGAAAASKQPQTKGAPQPGKKKKKGKR